MRGTVGAVDDKKVFVGIGLSPPEQEGHATHYRLEDKLSHEDFVSMKAAAQRSLNTA